MDDILDGFELDTDEVELGFGGMAGRVRDPELLLHKIFFDLPRFFCLGLSLHNWTEIGVNTIFVRSIDHARAQKSYQDGLQPTNQPSIRDRNSQDPWLKTTTLRY